MHPRNDFATIQLDASHHRFLTERPRAVFELETRQAERLDRFSNLPRDNIGRAEVHRSSLDFRLELRAARRTPATLGADPISHFAIGRPHSFARFFIGRGDKSWRVDTDWQLGHAELVERASIEVDIWEVATRIADDDGEHQSHAVARREQD